VVCIGPVTAKEARAHGLPVAAVARPHTMAGLVEALERALASRG
jgi:uroporphyrinogen-III synthase